jgi:hypothetical protein
VSGATASAPPRYRVKNFPPELLTLPRWVVFQIVHDVHGKTRKTPMIPGIVRRPGVKWKAESDNPATWRTFDEAFADAEVRGLYLAFAFDRSLPYFFLDGDDVLLPDGVLRPDIQIVRDTLDTYSEWSARRNGIHMIGKGAFPERSTPYPAPEGCKTIERYPLRGARFCIFTGDVIPGFETIEERGDVLAALFPPRATAHANGNTHGAGYGVPNDELTEAEVDAIVAWDAPLRTDGLRHHLSLYLSGYLGKQGVPRAQAAAITERCAADDSDPGAKITACHDTYDALEAGEIVSGWRGLQDVCGLGDEELRPLAAILDGYWNRCHPRPTPTAHGTATPFPTDVLPVEGRAFVRSAAGSIGCPEDFVAVPLLALAEGTIGKSRRLMVRPGFEVSPGSWYGVIAEPGTGKSPGQKYAMRVVGPLQDEAWDVYRDKLERWEATPKDERGEKPTPEHFFITDSTGEALWAALASSAGVTQLEDELRRRLKALDAYRQAGDRQAMLGLWSNAPVKIVRRTSAPVYIPFPVAPLVGGIQPGVLRHLRGEGDDAESDDGWVPRFLLCWPDAEPLELSDFPFDERTLPPLVETFRRLRLRQMQPHDTHLSAAAYDRFKAWHAENRRIQLQSSGLERQWAAKAPFHLARLALVLHLLAWADREHQDLSVATLSDAIRLLEYFRDHLARVLPAFGASARGSVKNRIIQILSSEKWKTEGGWVSRSDVGNGLRNVSPESMTAALEELDAAGVAEKESRPTTTKPAEWWRLTPEDSANTGREDSDYSGYHGGEGEKPNNPNNRNGVMP